LPEPGYRKEETVPKESKEPASKKQKKKSTTEEPDAAQNDNVSRLPQPAVAATPLKTKRSFFGIKARTPSNKTPIKPSGEEMHPEHHHQSTAKLLDEARWLGFQALGAHTAPPKATNADPLAIAQATPSKATTTSEKLSNLMSAAQFKFRFKSQASGLSPTSRRILNTSDEPQTPGQRLFKADEFSSAVDVSPRKIAVPKGKAPRFSDIHMAEFKKMDSIANHPSAFRADPSRFKPVNKSLKRSPSKAELDKPDTTMKPPATPLKRTLSKIEKSEPISLQRPSKTTIRMVQPSGIGVSGSRDDRPSSPAKRLKRKEEDDAATTRPVVPEEKTVTKKPHTPSRPMHSALPRATASRLMTPTRASMARTQSVKAVKTTTMIPSLPRAQSKMDMLSSTSIGESVKEGLRKTSNSLQKFKSILRTPAVKYSNDPELIAAGTHMSPPALNMEKALPRIPATAPVRKHVNFTASILERSESAEVGSPSPTKPVRVATPATVVYPAVESPVSYPKLPDTEEKIAATPSRKPAFGGLPGSMPGQFDFTSDKPVDFGPATKGTIRMVRKSDASSLYDPGKKRKIQTVEESSDKENQAEDQGRSPKKARVAAPEPPKTPTTKTPTSKTPGRSGKGPGGLSKSRLAFLATPKRFRG
jgi:hypothetical protein